MHITDGGVIFRNPLPGHRVINCIYPKIHILPDGEWLSVLRVGSALYSPDGILELFRSQDRGATWDRQGPFIDRSKDPVHYSEMEGVFSGMRDGSLMMRVSRCDMTDPDVLMFNEETGGLKPTHDAWVRSTDNGRTWTDPVEIPIQRHFDEGVEPAPMSGVIELADGSWFHCMGSWKSYNNAGPYDLQSYGLFSRDRGATWGEKIEIADGSQTNRSYSHGVPVELRDGRLMIAYWVAEPQLQSYYDLHTVVSTDDTAQSWEPPKATGIPGQTSHVAQLGGDRLIIIYSHRDNTDQPGIKVVGSADGGETWDLDDPLVVWDAYGKESLGVARTDTYPSSHDAIAYGAPRLTTLDDDRAVAAYWCTQGADTHCRWAIVKW